MTPCEAGRLIAVSTCTTGSSPPTSPSMSRAGACHSACCGDARRVADLVEEKFKKLSGKPEIYNIGTTIGAHTGPGTVAMFFFGDKREE